MYVGYTLYKCIVYPLPFKSYTCCVLVIFIQDIYTVCIRHIWNIYIYMLDAHCMYVYPPPINRVIYVAF